MKILNIAAIAALVGCIATPVLADRKGPVITVSLASSPNKTLISTDKSIPAKTSSCTPTALLKEMGFKSLRKFGNLHSVSNKANRDVIISFSDADRITFMTIEVDQGPAPIGGGQKRR